MMNTLNEKELHAKILERVALYLDGSAKNRLADEMVNVASNHAKKMADKAVKASVQELLGLLEKAPEGAMYSRERLIEGARKDLEALE